MKKLILVLLVLISSCGPMRTGKLWGQTSGANTVEIPIINNVTYTATTVLNSNALQNISQTSHEAKLYFTGISGAGAASYVGSIQGSIDCTTPTNGTYFDIGARPVSIGNLATGDFITLTGYGAFPCIRISGTLTITGGSATVTIYESYIGTSSPAFVTVEQFARTTGLMNETVATLTYGANTNLILTPGSGYSLALYGLDLSATSSLTAFELYCIQSGSPTPDSILAYFVSPNKTWPSEIRTYGICPVGDDIGYNATGSGVAGLTVLYRPEQ